jgi:hypothetical protein
VLRNFAWLLLASLMLATTGCGSSPNAAATARKAYADKLANEVSIRVSNVPLAKFAAQVEAEHDLDLRIDETELADFGIDTPVTIAVERIPLESALRLAARTLGLRLVVESDHCVITSHERSRQHKQTEVYPVPPWAHEMWPDEPEKFAVCLDDLFRERYLRTTLWRYGRPAPTSVKPEALPGAVRIVAPQFVHRRVKSFLREMDFWIDHSGSADIGPNDSAAMFRLRASLNQLASFEYRDLPLPEVLRQMTRDHNVNIVASRSVLANVAESPRISLTASSIPLRSAINLVTRQANVDWGIVDDVIYVDSDDRSWSNHPMSDLDAHGVRPYFIGDLVGPTDDGSLATAIHNCLQVPIAYSPQGRGLKIGDAFPRAGNAILIGQSVEGHAAVEGLLAALRQARGVRRAGGAGRRLPAGNYAANDVVRRALATRMTIDWREKNVATLCRRLAAQLGVTLQWEPPTLPNADDASIYPCAVRFENAAAGDILQRVLRPIVLEYLVVEGGLVVRSAATRGQPRPDHPRRAETWIYIENGLSPRPPGESVASWADEANTLSSALRVAFHGAARSTAVDGNLVVTAPPEIHARFQSWLDRIEGKVAPQGAGFFRIEPPTAAVVFDQDKAAASHVETRLFDIQKLVDSTGIACGEFVGHIYRYLATSTPDRIETSTDLDFDSRRILGIRGTIIATHNLPTLEKIEEFIRFAGDLENRWTSASRGVLVQELRTALDHKNPVIAHWAVRMLTRLGPQRPEN